MKECFECKSKKDLQEHHVVPRLRGGTMTVTLCYSCHMKAHGGDSKGLNHAKLTKEGLAKCNKPLGGQREANKQAMKAKRQATFDRVIPHLIEAKNQGITKLKDYAEFLNSKEIKTSSGKLWTTGTIDRFVKKLKEE